MHAQSTLDRPQFRPGSSIRVTDYGVERTGVVVIARSDSIRWVVLDGSTCMRWFHVSSLSAL